MIRVQWLGRDERGSLMISGMMLVLVMTLIGTGTFTDAAMEKRVALKDTKQSQAFYIAEAGLNSALRELADGDGTHDFSSVFTNGGSVVLYTNTPFPVDAQANPLGSFTVTAQAVAN